MATFIKAGFWETLCAKCTGYKGWLNLDQFVNSRIPTPAYKVYTALLTQSGGDDPQYQQLGSLVVGRTYEIADNGVIDWDFTNVGAPNNEIGTLFVAIGTTPANWGQNGVLNFNTGTPVVTVLENTIGNIWFTYDGIGAYAAHSDDLFTINKTVTQMLPEQYIEGLTDIFNYQSFPTNVNMIAIGSLANYNSEDSRLGNYAQNAIEIRVYN